MFRIVLLAALIAAGSGPALAQQPAKKEAAKKEATRNPFALVETQPLAFYVAKGEANACGLGCDEWIAVEGFFNSGSAARFREFMTRLGRRTLPVFFHSGGGLLNNAVVLGRTMRELGLTAGVARTTPEACRPDPNTKECAAAKKSGETLGAEWNSLGAVCGSACVYALLGARDRWVPAGARIGIHAENFVCVAPPGTPPEVRAEGCANSRAAGKAQLDAYVRQMGADTKLIEAAARVPHSEIRYLSRAEIAGFGISRGSFDDSVWQTVGGRTMVSFVNETNGADGPKRTAAIEYSCNTTGGLALAYYRPTDRNDTGAGTGITATIDGRTYRMPSGNVARRELIDADQYFDHRVLWLSGRHVDASTLSIEIREGGAPPLVLHTSFAGFARAWATLQKNCGLR